MRRMIAGFALLSLGVTGCGSSSMLAQPFFPETAATVARQDVRGNFFPLVPGRFLGFTTAASAFAQPNPDIDYTLEVRGPAPRLGPGVMEVADSETRAFLCSDQSGVCMKGLAAGPGSAVQRFARPIRLLTYPLRVGRVWTDRVGSGKEALQVRHWIADRMTVTTPLGAYDAFQIERRVWRGSTKPDFDADGLGRWTYWYAADLGPVQIGTRWPGLTYNTYQLTATARPALIQTGPTSGSREAWRGLAAGLEGLVRR
jgi:hypothetical protein